MSKDLKVMYAVVAVEKDAVYYSPYVCIDIGSDITHGIYGIFNIIGMARDYCTMLNAELEEKDQHVYRVVAVSIEITATGQDFLFVPLPT